MEKTTSLIKSKVAAVTSLRVWDEHLYFSITKGYFLRGGYSEKGPASNSQLQSCYLIYHSLKKTFKSMVDYKTCFRFRLISYKNISVRAQLL